MDYKQEVYKIVKKIPKGKVTTYGTISQYLKEKHRISISPQLVGVALHQNPDPKTIPCHRIVNREGKLASNFAFGGAKRQKEMLKSEGIEFKDPEHVNLEKCLWKP